MPMPDFIKKKIEAKKKKNGEEEEASPEAPVKKGGKVNPLMVWAKKNKV